MVLLNNQKDPIVEALLNGMTYDEIIENGICGSLTTISKHKKFAIAQGIVFPEKKKGPKATHKKTTLHYSNISEATDDSENDKTIKVIAYSRLREVFVNYKNTTIKKDLLALLECLKP